jgi:hypothetical protein
VSDVGKLYEFVARGLLTEQALDRAGRRGRTAGLLPQTELADALSLDLLDPEHVAQGWQMAIVYTAITAFENSARRFIAKVLREASGEGWWTTCVSEKIRKFAESRREDEEKTKWHGQRGDSLLEYTEMGHLVSIMQQNWPHFEDYVRRVDWATSIFGALERSRNVIMHSGTLEIEDVERVGINIRDWVKQVGA